MNIKITALVLLTCFSCQQKHENKDVTQLRKTLPQIELPIKFNSDLRVKYKTVELNDNDFIKKITERSTFSLIGKLFETENNITILGYTYNTIGTPVLITFDKEGVEVSTHAVFETANSKLGRHTSNVVTLFPDRQMLFTDSTSIRKLNEAGTDEIAGSDSVLLTHKKYLISDSGIVKSIE